MLSNKLGDLYMQPDNKPVDDTIICPDCGAVTTEFEVPPVCSTTIIIPVFFVA